MQSALHMNGALLAAAEGVGVGALLAAAGTPGVGVGAGLGVVPS